MSAPGPAGGGDPTATPAPLRRFVAVAVGDNDTLPPLPDAVADARALARLLVDRHGYAAEVLENPAHVEDLQDALARGSAANADLIVYWIGHGRRGPLGELELVGVRRGHKLASAADLGQWAAETGARQVMLLLDTCHSGGGLVDSLQKAFAVMSARNRLDGQWFGVLAASRAEQNARAGALVEAFRDLLDRGPQRPDARWTPGQPHLRGEDVLKVLADEWRFGPHADDQTVIPMNFGASQRPMLHNPRFDIGLGAQPVEHLLQAARGGGDVESDFTGRLAPLSTMVAWLRRRRPGLLAVSGPAGCGKSALLGRLASLSMPAERERLLRHDPPDAELDPGVGSVHAQLLLRGMTVESAPERLAHLLGTDPAQGLPGVMVLARERLALGAPLVLLLDGLDESGEAAGVIAQELIGVLARHALVVVATRRLEFGVVGLQSLPGVAVETLDLARDPAATLDDVRRYVVRRLTGVAPRMDPARVAEAVTAGRGADATAPFMLARLVTSQLQARPLDTGAADWQLSLVSSAQNALELDLRRVVLAPGGLPLPEAARELMGALARAQGVGFPADDVWLAVATRLSAHGIAYARDDVYALLDQLGRHVVSTVENGQTVYRIAHQVLADYLLSTAAADAPLATARAIADLWTSWLAAGNAPQAHGYLWTYGWLHLADAGAEGLALLEALAATDPAAFRLDLALAYERVAERAAAIGDFPASLAWRERSVGFRRELGDPGRLALALSRLSLARSQANDDSGAEAAAAEAAGLARSLEADAQAREVIVSAWLARAWSLLRLSKFDAARRWSDELLALVSGEGAVENQALCLAHLSVGTAANLQGDIVAGRHHCRTAVEVFDRVASAETETALLLEVLAAAMFAESLAPTLRLLGVLAADAPPPDRTPGLRLLAEHRRRGPLGSEIDVVTAKGLLSLARVEAEAIDPARSMTPSPVELLHETIALASGASTGAVLMRSIARTLLAQWDTNPASATAALGVAIEELRGVAAGSPLASYQLGECLNFETYVELTRSENGVPADLGAAIARQLEAVACLRQVAMPSKLATLLGALSWLSWLQSLAGEPERAAATRDEALKGVAALAELPAPLRPMVAGLLADQAAFLLASGRAIEALALAERGGALADQLTDEPPRRLMKAMALVQQAIARLVLDRPPGPRPLFEEAETLVADLPMSLSVLLVRVDVDRNLALIDLREGRTPQALARARRAALLLATPGLPAAALTTAPIGEVVLGQAECAAGEAVAGQARLGALVDQVRALALQDRPEVDAAVVDLALRIVRVVPDLWLSIESALQARPVLRDVVAWQRPRPPEEWTALAGELGDALRRAEGRDRRKIRQIARTHRSLDPVRFDAAWQAACGESPAWLDLDLEIEWLVIGWWNTAHWWASRDYLQSQPRLLDGRAAAVLDEFALDAEVAREVERHRHLLDEARRSGVDAAYAPLLLAAEVAEWVTSDDPQSHLARRPELGRADVGRCLREYAESGNRQDMAFLSIWELLQRSEERLAFELHADAAAGARLLQASSLRAADPPRLRSLARLVWAGAEAGPLRRRAALAWAVADALEASTAARPALAEELAGLPAVEQGDLVGMVTAAIGDHPQAAAGLAALISDVIAAAEEPPA